MEIQDRMTAVFPVDDHIPAAGSFNLHTENDARKHSRGNFLIHLISHFQKLFNFWPTFFTFGFILWSDSYTGTYP